jgi:predicted Zn-dependent protease
VDEAMRRAALSFHPLREDEKPVAEPRHLRLRTAAAGDTYAALAARSRLTGDAEAQLRLLNASYPTGEPKPEEVIKLVE